MKDDIENANKDGAYEKSASAPPSSYTYSQKYLGDTDDYYDPDLLHGESYATLLTFSAPPEVIRGGETVSLSFSLSFTDNNLSYFDGHGSARADWGNPGRLEGRKAPSCFRILPAKLLSAVRVRTSCFNPLLMRIKRSLIIVRHPLVSLYTY